MNADNEYQHKGIKVVVARVRQGRHGLTARYQAVCQNCAKGNRRTWPVGRQTASDRTALIAVRRHAQAVGCHLQTDEAVPA